MIWESTPGLLIKAQYRMRQERERVLGFTRHSAVAPERLEAETYYHENHLPGTDVLAAGCCVDTGCGQQEQ